MGSVSIFAIRTAPYWSSSLIRDDPDPAWKREVIRDTMLTTFTQCRRVRVPFAETDP
jgi:hypothetical protein